MTCGKAGLSQGLSPRPWGRGVPQSQDPARRPENSWFGQRASSCPPNAPGSAGNPGPETLCKRHRPFNSDGSGASCSPARQQQTSRGGGKVPQGNLPTFACNMGTVPFAPRQSLSLPVINVIDLLPPPAPARGAQTLLPATPRPAQPHRRGRPGVPESAPRPGIQGGRGDVGSCDSADPSNGLPGPSQCTDPAIPKPVWLVSNRFHSDPVGPFARAPGGRGPSWGRARVRLGGAFPIARRSG